MAIMALSRALCVLLLMAIVSTEAAKIETFNERGCEGGATNTFHVGGNTCQKFIDQGSVRISEISSNTRVSFHNQLDCSQKSSVGQSYGPVHCRNQGGTKIRAVWIQGDNFFDDSVNVLETVLT